jgi:hypothetical protein
MLAKIYLVLATFCFVMAVLTPFRAALAIDTDACTQGANPPHCNEGICSGSDQCKPNVAPDPSGCHCG